MGGGRIPVVKGAQTGGGVCDGLIGAFHGGGGGYAKVHILLHFFHLRILVCAAFFEFILYFLKKISWLSGVVGWLVVVLPFLWLVSTVLLILIRLNCWVVLGICLVSFSEKIIFCICIFSDFHSLASYFLIALGPFSQVFFCLIDFCQGF